MDHWLPSTCQAASAVLTGRIYRIELLSNVINGTLHTFYRMFYLSVVFLVIAFVEIKNSTDNHCITPHEILINKSVPEVCCDTCNTWFHTQCESIRDTIYDTMQNSNTSWNCRKCGMPNFSSTLFNYDDIEYSENTYQHISHSNDNSIQLPSTPAGLGPPLHTP